MFKVWSILAVTLLASSPGNSPSPAKPATLSCNQSTIEIQQYDLIRKDVFLSYVDAVKDCIDQDYLKPDSVGISISARILSQDDSVIALNSCQELNHKEKLSAGLYVLVKKPTMFFLGALVQICQARQAETEI